MTTNFAHKKHRSTIFISTYLLSLCIYLFPKYNLKQDIFCQHGILIIQLSYTNWAPKILHGKDLSNKIYPSLAGFLYFLIKIYFQVSISGSSMIFQSQQQQRNRYMDMAIWDKDKIHPFPLANQELTIQSQPLIPKNLSMQLNTQPWPQPFHSTWNATNAYTKQTFV